MRNGARGGFEDDGIHGCGGVLSGAGTRRDVKSRKRGERGREELRKEGERKREIRGEKEKGRER
jgi:hypothetical protein